MKKVAGLWHGLGCLMILGVIFYSLTPSLPGFLQPFGVRVWVACHSVISGDKVFHLAVYFLLMLWFVPICRRERHTALAVSLVILGLCIEGLQAFTGCRAYEMQDLLANTLGIGVAWGLTRIPFPLLS